MRVHIITGDVNTGKTTRLLALYSAIKKGDGFVIPKIFSNGVYVGQKLVQLSSKEEVTFSMLDDFIPTDWNEAYKYYNYSFGKEGQCFLEHIERDILDVDTSPIFIDEIGPLELMGKGSATILRKTLAKNMPTYLVIRSTCLKEVINKYGILSYEIV